MINRINYRIIFVSFVPVISILSTFAITNNSLINETKNYIIEIPGIARVPTNEQ